MTKVVDIPKEYQPAINELPGDLSRIAEVIEEHRPGCGVELALFLGQAFRGQSLYFRNVDYIVRRMRDDIIRAEYDGGAAVRAIALKWGISTRWVESILSRPGKKNDRQLELF